VGASATVCVDRNSIQPTKAQLCLNYKVNDKSMSINSSISHLVKARHDDLMHALPQVLNEPKYEQVSEGIHWRECIVGSTQGGVRLFTIMGIVTTVAMLLQFLGVRTPAQERIFHEWIFRR